LITVSQKCGILASIVLKTGTRTTVFGRISTLPGCFRIFINFLFINFQHLTGNPYVLLIFTKIALMPPNSRPISLAISGHTTTAAGH
jgi:hypothetical protein